MKNSGTRRKFLRIPEASGNPSKYILEEVIEGISKESMGDFFRDSLEELLKKPKEEFL